MIRRAIWQKKPLERPEFLLINVFAQPPGVSMSEYAVIAVDRRQHALQQRGAGHAGRDKCAMVGQPAMPASCRRRGWTPVFGSQQPVEPGDTPPQGAHTALPGEPMAGEDDAAEEVYALIAALQHDLVGMQFEPQPGAQEVVNGEFPAQQRGGIVGQQNEIVHIAQVGAHLEGVFDELVEFVEIDVGEELAGEAADWQADAGRAVKQRFVRRNLCEQGEVAASARRRVQRRLGQDGGGNLIQPAAGGFRAGQFGQCLPPEIKRDAAVYAGKEGADVELEIPALRGLTHEALQPLDSGLGAFAFAVGIAVVDEAFIPPGVDVAHQPLLHQPVGKVRGEYLPQLGVGDGKHGEGLRLVSAFGNGGGLFEHQPGQLDEAGALVFAIAGVGGAFEQLAGDRLPGHVGFGHAF